MPVHTQCSADGQELTIQVDGRFDFSVHREFRDALIACLATQSRVVVDLNRTEYMDSSALGMLLLLREKSAESDISIHLRNPRPEVLQVLMVSNFHKMFVVD